MNENISPSTKIAQYRIVSKIGAGGMGEVYRAHDSRLNRDVAIKLLPAEFAHHEDRLRRFEQEARATSALNHPNILTVYDIGEHEGSPFMVTELLEGEELRQRLDHGPIPLRKVTEYAQQIVSGLSAAHEKGIVHRDLKPENLFITNDDRVKILDFGLAKLREPKTTSQGSEDATMKALTNPGVVMGTAGYMSPEQVRGQATDYRSDIFSFGLILHEMISGRRALQRETMAETMSAILKEEPEELTKSNPNVSPALDRIVRRCLEKKPERRFQSTSDLGFALESLSASTGSSSLTVPEVIAELESPRLSRIPILYALGFLLLLGGIVAGLVGTRLFRQAPVPNYEQLTFRRGFVYHARFAPDGQTIVYSGAWNDHPSEIFSTRAGLS
ncbi:MAG TPA: serine/threonine-protein kinase, partial [Pyrinomonadaceae bacterium]|nr:serine/threonine-protein kinase [Pyrinomonadaceae bacterium]